MADRWMDKVPDAPAGMLGAWFNALVGGALVAGAPTIAFTAGEAPASVLLAIAALGVFGVLEVVFVYKLYQRIAGRRALRSERATIDAQIRVSASIAVAPIKVAGVTEPQQRSMTERFLGRPKLWYGWVWAALALAWLVLALIDPSPFRFFIAALWLLVGALNLIGAYAYRRRTRQDANSEESADKAPSMDSTNH